MGTTSSSLSSTSSSSTASTFNGTSQYAADLQQAITHAVTVASIPLTELQNNLSHAAESVQRSRHVATAISRRVQAAIQNLSSVSGGSSFAATSADQTVASVSLDSTAQVTAGTYDINVISAGSQTTTLEQRHATNGGRSVIQLDQHFRHLFAHRGRVNLYSDAQFEHAGRAGTGD